ncbi:MAG: DJ-1/PfpI family protein [Treponema sp.]|nr:DJ-1/PfpI family protein [Treponema sp.]
MNKKAIVLLADGFEDVEAVTPVDYLRRAGIEVTTVSISASLIVTSRWGEIKLTANKLLAEVIGQSGNWDAVIIPGGLPGAANLAASAETSVLIKEIASSGKLICAICASPVIVLAPLGLITRKKYTCYPGLEEKTKEGQRLTDRVVIDGNILTSQGAGTAGEFSIAIIEKLLGKETANKIKETVLL